MTNQLGPAWKSTIKIEDKEVNALKRWHKEKEYCRHPLHTNIWHRTQTSVRVSHAFYMNDERDLDPFYLEYDR